MLFKLALCLISLILANVISADSLIYKSSLDPNVGCDSWSSWWCDIKFGIKMAESSGVNGILISGYAYHTSVGLHFPVGHNEEGPVNEITAGAGYTRTFFNPQYNSEYALYASGFMDSYYKIQLQVGYAYQQYFNLTNSGNLKWGLGYTPFIFIKPAYTNDAPVPLPGVGLVTSLKYNNVDLILTYVDLIFLSARIDF
ncbi:MAG: hypothetical protein KBD37_01890 [Burkholderiales bacterium]|nr:hypothetical protein [Burkholderiales bacterium]